MMRLTVSIFLAAFIVAGCGGGSGSSTPPPSTGGGGGSTLQANFQSIQDNIFTPRCTGCHVGASAPLGLRLDDVNSFGLLVGVTSAQAAPLLRVEPGDPDDSYLIQKLEGTASVGGQMPLGGTPLPQADINVVRQWITDGALPPGGTPVAPIRVTSLSPLPDSELDTLPASIIAMFDRELEATSVDATTFILERSGGDGTFGDGNETMIAAAAISVSMASPMTATFDLTGVASENDTYRVRLLGTGGATIRDLDANALDGEFAGVFPSGDGTQGGDFEAFFTVAALIPTLDSIQEKIFTPTCATAGCHSGAMPAAGQDLSDADASFNALVMMPSNQSALFRVLPGDPDMSYLIEKLEQDMPTGGLRMPRNGPPYLDQADIDVIRQWITDGANR